MADDGRGEVHRDAALRRELRRCPVANLLLRVDKRARPHMDPACDCWVWLDSHDDEGYPRVWWQGRNWHLTRALMTALLDRELERWEHVHHECLNNWCANPGHMRVLHWKAHHWAHGWRPKTETEALAAD